MQDEDIKRMVLDIIGEVDYDICKDYCVERAEEPELVAGRLDKLVEIVRTHLKGGE